MAPGRTPHHLWARNEARCSCYGAVVITRNTFDVARGFDCPAGDARRSYAMGCKRASLQTPFAQVNRTSALAAEVLLLIRVAKVFPARARRYSQSASGMDRFVVATDSPIPRLLQSGP